MPEPVRPLAVVTGAARGIGFELAKQFSTHGFDLVIADDEPAVMEAAKAIGGADGAKVEPIQVDLAAPDGASRLLQQVGGRPIEALAANASRGLGKSFFDKDFGGVVHVIDTNITGELAIINAIGRQMRDRRRGRILITDLDSFASAIREELRGAGVTVTSLAAGAAEAENAEPGQSGKPDLAKVADAGFAAMMRGDGDAATGPKDKPRPAGDTAPPEPNRQAVGMTVIPPARPNTADAAPNQPKPQPAAQAAPVQPKPQPITEAAPAQPKPQPIAQATPVQPKPQPVAQATPVQPKPQPVAQAAPAQPKPQPVAQAAPAQPKPQPVAQAAPVQPKPQPIAQAAPARPKPQPVAQAAPAQPKPKPVETHGKAPSRAAPNRKPSRAAPAQTHAAPSATPHRPAKHAVGPEQLLVTELREIYSAEKQLTQALPRLAKAVENEHVRRSLERRHDKGQRLTEDLEKTFQALEASPGRKKNVAAEGLIADAQGRVQEIEKGPALDAVLVDAVQKAEHYCIAAWGAAKAFAKAVGRDAVTRTTERALRDGKSFDEEMSRLAESEINPAIVRRAGWEPQMHA